MANSHSVIPFDDEQLANKEVIEFLNYEMVFAPKGLPLGRFPALTELRHAIQETGYALEEENDWYVTSDDDHTEIWFNGEIPQEDSPSEFWFRRGDLIVLDIAQSVANQCGSLIVIDSAGSVAVLLVPDTLFPTSAQSPDQRRFVATIARRIPIMIARLTDASLEDTLFILSQIRQALRSTNYLYQHELFATAQQGFSEYKRLLDHEDARVRYLAFDLVATFRERFYESSESLRLSIKNESNSNTKKYMIEAIEHLLVPGWIGGEIYPTTGVILDLLRELNEDIEQPKSIQLAAANLLARAQPGLLTLAMQTVLIDALFQPEQYEPNQILGYSLLEQVLKSIENMLLNHRLRILLTALPKITVAQYAHDVLRALLDNVFFGAVHPTRMSSLMDTQEAERPLVDESKFIQGQMRGWLYPANPTKLAASELLPIQREVLETVIALDIPWMVHSNLLEKYGLPPTRSSIRTMLGVNP